MAKISELSQATGLSGSELLPVVVINDDETKENKAITASSLALAIKTLEELTSIQFVEETVQNLFAERSYVTLADLAVELTKKAEALHEHPQYSEANHIHDYQDLLNTPDLGEYALATDFNNLANQFAEVEANTHANTISIETILAFLETIELGSGNSGGGSETESGHSHSNFNVLETITLQKVVEWDKKSNFSGDYNDLTNKPTIPTVDVNKQYVDNRVASLENSIEGILQRVDNEKIINARLGYGDLQPCLCNGINDDSVQLQQMVDYLSANGGGTVYIPSGVYTQKSQINWKTGVSLIGDGQGRSILKVIHVGNGEDFGFASIGYDKSNLAQIKQEKMKNCRFENFEIDGSGMVNIKYNSYGKGLYLVYLYNCVFRDIYLHDISATGLGIDFLCNTIIDNVTVDNCGRLYKTAPNDAYRQGGAGIGIGTNRDLNESFQIVNCRANNCGSFGIFVENQKLFDAQQEVDSKNMIISNNIVTNCYRHGIGVRACDGVVIANNIIKRSGEDNIYVDNMTKNVTIMGNIIDGEQHSANGIGLHYYETWETQEQVGSLHNIYIQNNSIENTRFNGILLNTATINGVTIEGNKIKNVALSRSEQDNFVFKGCINFNRTNETLKCDWNNIVISNNTLLTNFSAGSLSATTDYGWGVIFISTNATTDSTVSKINIHNNILSNTMQGVRFSVLSSTGKVSKINVNNNTFSTYGKAIEIEKYVSELSISHNTFENCNSLALNDTRCIVAWGGSVDNVFIIGNGGYSKNMSSLFATRSNVNKSFVCNNVMRLASTVAIEYLEVDTTKDCIEQYNIISN